MLKWGLLKGLWWIDWLVDEQLSVKLELRLEYSITEVWFVINVSGVYFIKGCYLFID